jgi:malonyl-CoA O-methyltransferase
MNSDSHRRKIVSAFDAAARTYDSASQVQRQVARELAARAARDLTAAPRKILDLGCGAGHVVEAALALWPEAEIVALDAAPAMLAELRKKFPGVTTLCRDATNLDDIGRYDLILSNMMLHWLPDPRGALAQWRRFLAPEGVMHIALPVEGSLSEWRDACRAANLSDGLWLFPAANFADGLANAVEYQAFAAVHADARAFLQSLKGAGAHRSRADARPHATGELRRLLAARQQPFTATFQVAFLKIAAPAT